MPKNTQGVAMRAAPDTDAPAGRPESAMDAPPALFSPEALAQLEDIIEARVAERVAERDLLRPTRAQEQRDAEPVHEVYDDDEIAPSLLLDTRHIPARPGFVQRWVRTKAAGIDDPNNVARRWNEGWRPRPADSVPEGAMAPTVSFGNFGNVIGLEGNVLMEMPEDRYARRRRAIRAQTRMQLVAADTNPLKEGPIRGFGTPYRDRESSRTSSIGRPMPVADD